MHRVIFEIWPGIISAIRLHEEKTLLCCETLPKLLRTDNILAFFKELYKRFGNQYPDKAEQILVGSNVLTRYNNRMYRVNDIIWTKHPTNIFRLSDGTKTTYIDYYAKHFNQVITNVDQPLLLSKAKIRDSISSSKCYQDVYLVPELCSISGLTSEIRSDWRLMKDLAYHVSVPPSARVGRARTFLKNIRENPDANKIYKSWNLELGEDLVELSARILPQESLFFGQQMVAFDQQNAVWLGLKKIPLENAINLDNWMLIFTERNEFEAKRFYDIVRSLGRPMNVEVSEPMICKLNGDTASDFLDGIKKGLKKSFSIQMVVAMVPNDNKTRYDSIKKLCCLDSPVPSQVIRASSMEKHAPIVCSKVLLQINCKLGGSIWRVDVPMKKVMVVGYDVSEDSSNSGKMVGAAVFSSDSTLTKWYSQCALHVNSKQLVSNLIGFFRNGIKKYFDRNGFLPERIFFYRDGVADRHISVVYSEELPQIQKVIKEMGVGYKPKFSFIIVSKRIDVKFFEKNDGIFTNPPPGTVVDDVVTKPEKYDFYLVPQSVRQGTVTPVSYNVIFDDSGLKPDHMQRMAYKMCHLYYNWQGTIRVPAPCQYAHKLAFLVSQSLHFTPDDSLSNKLFFL